MSKTKVEFSLTTVQLAVGWKLLRNLNSQHFCQTGSMSITREEMTQLIVACGGNVNPVVKNQTNFLIVPNDPSFRKGSKYKAAESQGVKIITEGEFCGMILPTEDELRK